MQHPTTTTSATRPDTFHPGCSRAHQEWVLKRLPLTAEQYRDLCCGLRNEEASRLASEESGDNETMVIDLSVPAKKRKK